MDWGGVGMTQTTEHTEKKEILALPFNYPPFSCCFDHEDLAAFLISHSIPTACPFQLWNPFRVHPNDNGSFPQGGFATHYRLTQKPQLNHEWTPMNTKKSRVAPLDRLHPTGETCPRAKTQLLVCIRVN
jgi:hypothetical protein